MIMMINASAKLADNIVVTLVLAQVLVFLPFSQKGQLISGR